MPLLHAVAKPLDVRVLPEGERSAGARVAVVAVLGRRPAARPVKALGPDARFRARAIAICIAQRARG